MRRLTKNRSTVISRVACISIIVEWKMNSLNAILVEGSLAGDPVMTKTPKGTSVCAFTVASVRYYKEDGEYKNETSFFDIECRARLAETCRETLKKDHGVRIVGRLKQDRWRDKDYNSRSSVKIVAEHVEIRPVKKEVVDG